MIGRPILFLGYSLSDLNIRVMLSRLSELWGEREQHRPRSYLVQSTPNLVQEKVLDRWGVTLVVADEGEGDRENALVSFLNGLPQPI